MLPYWRFRRCSAALIAGFLIILASTGLAACGYNGLPQSSTSATQGQTQETQTPQTQAPRQSQAPVQKCGFVFGYEALTTMPQDAGSQKAEGCFWQAFQHCSLATLVFTSSSNGKGIGGQTIVRTFTIHQANGACFITDALQKGATPRTLQPATIYTCTGLIQHPGALDILSCGPDGTINVAGV